MSPSDGPLPSDNDSNETFISVDLEKELKDNFDNSYEDAFFTDASPNATFEKITTTRTGRRKTNYRIN